MKKAATPSTVLLPWRYKDFDAAPPASRSARNVAHRRRPDPPGDAGRSTDEGLSLTVPIADMALPTENAGVAVKWDTERARPCSMLRNDEPLERAPPGTDGKPSEGEPHKQ